MRKYLIISGLALMLAATAVPARAQSADKTGRVVGTVIDQQKLPLSLVGVAVMLFFTHDTLNNTSMIGLIMLMGLVTKNAILLVDFTNQARREGMSRHQALLQAGTTRLRPSVTTTLAMIFGCSRWRSPSERAPSCGRRWPAR